MKSDLLPSTARDQLNLVLDFFHRVDAKASVVLAVDTGMAGYLASHLPSLKAMPIWQMLAPLLTFGLLGQSFWHLYKGAFPNLEGGNLSLVYFREIAKRTEAKFIDEFLAQSESEYTKDVLGQVWRNSQILAGKFGRVKLAFIFMALAVFPWVISLAQFTVQRASLAPQLP